MADAVMQALAQLAAGDDTAALVAFCEKFEVTDLGHLSLEPATSFAVYKVHLAAYLMCEQLNDARFLWKRMPAEQRDADAELVAIWNIGKAMWAKDIAGAQAAMGAYSWAPPLLSGLLERMQREHLQRSFGHCARAYSLISAEHLAQTLGARLSRRAAPRVAPLPAARHQRLDTAPHDVRRELTRVLRFLAAGVPVAKVQQMADAAGWTSDVETGAYGAPLRRAHAHTPLALTRVGWALLTSFAPRAAAVPATPTEPAGKVELMPQLKILTDYVAHVEKELK